MATLVVTVKSLWWEVSMYIFIHIFVDATAANNGFGTVILFCFFYIGVLVLLMMSDLCVQSSFKGHNVFKQVCTIACCYLT